MKVLNFFTYDYPFEGNDQNFIEDELVMLSTLFDKINVIPIKNKGKFSKSVSLLQYCTNSSKNVSPTSY